jgi:predicted ATPase/DNA-binding SARP family transcriptional activator/Tfp pilus assembly protein PilF
MVRVALFLLGSPRIERDGAPVRVDRRKAVALIAYLAMTGESHSRDTLATLLWPEHDQSRARAGLRAALSTLKKALSDGWLGVDRESVGLNPDVAPLASAPGSASERELWLDVAEFRGKLAECRTHGHPEEQVCPDCLPALAEAAELYRDDFLAGFTLRDSPAFDEWQFFQTEGLRNELLGALARLARGYGAQGALQVAITYARRWAALDPLHEPAHRQLMRLYAWSEQRTAALRQYDECARVLQEELGVSPEQETVQLYRTIKGQQEPPPPEDEFVAPVTRQGMGGTRPQVAHNLPVQVTPFVGRAEELAQIHQRLADPDCRLLTLVGPGGVGKTRLATEAVATLIQSRINQTWFSYAVCFVPLAPVSEADMLVPAISSALDLPTQGAADPRQQLLSYLRDKTFLLVLDNVEHLLDSMHLATDVLAAAPRVKILTTSRAALNLRQECLFPVEGLRFPSVGEADGAEAGDLVAYGAVELFVQCARRANPGFSLSAERQCVAQICRLVEGLPLAIELAAAWARQMPCRTIAQELQRGIDVLTTRLRDAPDRHRSMRAVFEQSWQLLPQEERAALRKLSVFRGGFLREAAEEVASASLFQLSALVDKSLLRVDPSGRYGLHELLRQFAAERLQQQPSEAETTQDRHSKTYLAVLRQQEGHFKGPKLKEALAAIRADIDNVRLAWRWAVEHDNWANVSAAMESLGLFYEIQGWFLEGNDAFARAVARLRQQLEQPAVAGTAAPPGETRLMLGVALAYQGWFQVRLGLRQQAGAIGDESLAILRTAGDSARRETALSLFFLSVLARFREEYDAARDLLHESRALFDRIGDDWASARTLIGLGQTAVKLGQYAEAEQYSQRSIAIFEAMDEQRWIVYSMSTLGRVAMARGQYARAVALHHECLQRRRTLGDRPGMSFTLTDLGDVARLQRRPNRAKEYYEQSLALAKDTGNRVQVALALTGLSKLAEMRGDYEEAKQLAQESKDSFQTCGSDLYLGWAALGSGEYQVAGLYFHGVLKAATEAQMVPLTLDAVAGFAHLLARTGKPARAVELLALVMGQPASAQECKDRAARLQAELTTELPTELVGAAQGRGRARELDATVAELLSEMGQ